MKLESYSRCSCGAVTVYADDGRSYSVDSRNRRRFLPGVDLRKLRRMDSSYCCDRCANHYGLDLCACGSGEPFDECESGLPCCGEPSQVLGGRECFKDPSGWGIRQ